MIKKIHIRFFCLALLAIAAFSCNSKVEFGKHPVAKVVAAMTLDEKASLLVGKDRTCAIPRLGIPSVMLPDANSATTPVVSMLAQSWNLQLIEQTGAVTGAEAKRSGAYCMPVPELNLQDPVVWGKTTAALARGIQSNGVGAIIRQPASNTDIKGFEIAVRESQPWAVVAADSFADSILRGDWGFDGIVITDRDSCDNRKNAIIEAVVKGTLDESAVDRSVTRILETIAQSLLIQESEPVAEPDTEAQALVIRSVTTESMVLLKNQGALPLDSKCRMISLYGTGLDDALKGAGYRLEPSVSAAYRNGKALERKPYQYRADAIASDIAIITLTDIEQGLIRDVCDAFHSKNKKVVVVLNTDAYTDTVGWTGHPDAILLSGMPGKDTWAAVTDLLKGSVNPSGKLLDGFGLSYTTFTHSEPQVTIAEDKLTVAVKVTNTGLVAGKQTVRLYLDTELKAYGKTALLEPGNSEVLEFSLEPSNLPADWDTQNQLVAPL